MKIHLDMHPDDAPCCIKLIADNGEDILVQTDWDYPGIATTFGWNSPCKCGASDGTIDCDCATAAEMIGQARDYLYENDGMEVEDPGYFG